MDTSELLNLLTGLACTTQDLAERCVAAAELLVDPYQGVNPMAWDLTDAVGFQGVPDTFPADWAQEQ